MYFYIAKKTFLHRLDPRTKFFLLLFGLFSALIFNAPHYQIPALLLVLILILIAGGLQSIYAMRYILLLLFLFSFILWSLFIKEGKILFKLGTIRVTEKSLLYGTGMGLRLNLMVLAGLLFLTITMVEEFCLALVKLGIPYPISFASSLAFRLVPIFLNVGSTVLQAQVLRGLDLKSGNIFDRLRKHLPLIIPIFISIIKGVNNLSLALEAKGFGIKRQRSYYLKIGYRFFDYMIIVLLCILSLLLLFLRIKGYGIVLNRL
ncbi:MAG: energy-coupling factor transporter transmembrane component T [candidate division WOR-3 bacterium]